MMIVAPNRLQQAELKVSGLEKAAHLVYSSGSRLVREGIAARLSRRFYQYPRDR
jgi:hypothetical protein